MRLSDMYRDGRFGLSIEIFPPKSAEGDSLLWDSLDRLKRFAPDFVSCTYGAGGSTRSRTVELCREIRTRHGIAATAHFTCLGGTPDELRDWLVSARGAGVASIMALRGDPPAGQTQFTEVPGGFRQAAELVRLIHQEFPEFGIGVAGYPEKHPQAQSLATDIRHLAEKVAEGADAVFTQLFFVNDHYFRFVDAARKAGVQVPIVPGIMPVTNYAQIKRITALCGAELPVELATRLEAAQADKDAQLEIGVEFAIEQCRQLVDRGVPGIHFYALNRSQACELILDGLAYQPAVP
jgi:methylenetetrahydrofolate reductase (NADPH)